MNPSEASRSCRSVSEIILRAPAGAVSRRSLPISSWPIRVFAPSHLATFPLSGLRRPWSGSGWPLSADKGERQNYETTEHSTQAAGCDRPDTTHRVRPGSARLAWLRAWISPASIQDSKPGITFPVGTRCDPLEPLEPVASLEAPKLNLKDSKASKGYFIWPGDLAPGYSTLNCRGIWAA